MDIDENKALKATERAARANAIINDEEFKSAIEAIDSELIDRLRGTEDPITRDAIWQSIQVLAQIPKTLKRVIQNGKVAKADLDRLSKVPEIRRVA